MSKVACVTVVRNEARFIAEFVAWQFVIGFDAVVLLDNDSTDGTAAAAQAVRGDVRVIDWRSSAPDYQIRGFEHACRVLAGEFAWLAFFDADEFLVLPKGETLKALLARRSDADAIGVPWAVFGSAGRREAPGGLVIESYSSRAAAGFFPNRHIKSIVRPTRVMEALNPHSFRVRGRYAGLDGRELAFERPGVLAETPDFAAGKLHHYFCKSWADWQRKLRRGYRDTDRLDSDFQAHDINTVADNSAALLAPAVRAWLAPSVLVRPEPEFCHAIVACARWEGRYIVEWLNYYRLLGFDHVFLYCNDDDPGPFYGLVLPFTLGERPFVSFRYHAQQGEQARMYAHFLQTDLHRCGWISFFDVDEFLRLPAGMTITDFMRQYEDHADCVLFNWLFFGTNGHKTPPTGHVLETYIRREGAIHCLTKYVARAAIFQHPGFTDPKGPHWFWHWPGYILGSGFRPVNVLHEDMSDYYEGFPERPGLWVNQAPRHNRLLETAAIHHYSFRSEQSFWDRAARGLGGEFGPQDNWRNLAEGETFAGYLGTINATEDTSLATFWPDIRERAYDNTTLAKPMVRLISRGRRARQSSVSQWSRGPTPEKDATGALNGRIDGTAKFHTALEEHPWWEVDLGAIAEIQKIKIFNVTGDTGPRFRRFALSAAIDDASWVEIYRKDDDTPVGGILTEPFIWDGPGSAWARFVRITLIAHDCLHLDQVEIFGRVTSFAAGPDV
jgi:glycosyltransferase involved in cell wall biosynthesis